MTAFPADRPSGLRLRPAGGRWWRIDAVHPDEWDWEPHPEPRGRFDPLSGRFRVRYAANRAAVAARERFPGRVLTEPDGDLFLVEIDSLPPALHLTHQTVLDALDLDDRVSTGRIGMDGRVDPDPLLETCGALADAVHDWWAGAPPPLVYRSRVMPQAGRNVAFTRSAAGRVVSARRLVDARSLHTGLVLQSGFNVPPAWLA